MREVTARTRVAHERRSPLDELVARLRGVGATPEEVDVFRRAWADPQMFDDEEKAELIALSNDELRHELAIQRGLEPEGSLEEPAGAGADGAVVDDGERALLEGVAMSEAIDRIGGNVQSILDWVAEVPVRAWAVLQVETAAEHQRSTLVEPLGPVAEGWAADGS